MTIQIVSGTGGYLTEGTHAERVTLGVPATPTDGILVFYETDTGKTFLWNTSGAAWVQIAGTGGSVSRNVVAKTANYGVLAGDVGTFFTNTGAVGEVDFTLPAWAQGLWFEFMITAAQILKIILPAANTLYLDTNVTSAAGNVSNNQVGSTIQVVATDASDVWMTVAATGTWSWA